MLKVSSVEASLAWLPILYLSIYLLKSKYIVTNLVLQEALRPHRSPLTK